MVAAAGLIAEPVGAGARRGLPTGRIVRRRGVALFRPRYARAKRAFDLGLTLLGLPLVCAAIAFCALLIWVSDGRPILFTQHRTGKGGRRFVLYKLRTMVKNAEELKPELAALNQRSGPDFKIEADPRITRLGRVLRSTSLDELPQIFNVLKGDMSVVGPRPTSFRASSYSLWHTERLEVLPGITGLWQVSGRSDVEFDDRVRLDIEYLERRGFGYDAWILVRTAGAVLWRRGAY